MRRGRAVPLYPIEVENAAAYLRDRGRLPDDGRPVRVEALAWGVSNVVLRVEAEGLDPFVLKQSREQLRTAMHWVSRLERTWAEAEALRVLAPRLPAGSVPGWLWEERADYAFAMTCAPPGSGVWKARLLAGEADANPGREAGTLLARMHATPLPEGGPLDDPGAFVELRLDPFYRTAAARHPDLAGRLEALAAACLDPPERTFTHADFSPKNLLVHPGGSGLTAVDFETAHRGEPAFDLGFFASHLLLKALRSRPGHAPYLRLLGAFAGAYVEAAGPSGGDRLDRAAGHAAGCLLARIDGKSPVDYLDDPGRASARRLARAVLTIAAPGWRELIDISAQEMLAGTSGEVE